MPARNEEANLRACLESLVSQSMTNSDGGPSPSSGNPDAGVPNPSSAGVGNFTPALEIIVVDDGSTDGTRAIAESFPEVRVIEPGPLPPGWTGKNNAVTAGAREARGQWLLFTDADTVHKPGSLARALAEAQQHGADLLSYSPEQELHSFWEKAVMPVIFAELARKFPPARVSDPSSNLAAANGQYLLVSRTAYDAVGGHAAVAQSLLEDVALARAVRDASFKIRFRYGGDAVRTRMYRGFRQMREGWTKNLYLLFPNAAVLAFWRLLEFALVMASLIMAVQFAAAGDWRHVPLFLILPLMTVLRIATAHFSWSSNLLGILGLPIFSYLLLRSRLGHVSGGVSWKGRTYSGRARIKPVS